ncbi:MAG: sigma-54 dependent transcriptional regulator [Thermodesulfobacteriota bacterium]
MKHILVISQNPKDLPIITEAFAGEGRVRGVETRAAALATIAGRRFDYVFADLAIVSPTGGARALKEALAPFFTAGPHPPELIVMTKPETVREAVQAVQVGAVNYLTYPLTVEEIRLVVESLEELSIVQSELDYLRGKFWKADMLKLVRTNCPAMKKVYNDVRSVAPTRSTVLITGETGTGKGVLARLIHRHSNRSEGAFISVHCGAIPENLIESELFGHEKGAFTGAVKRKLGRFEIARGGTIFLDEVGTLTASAQVKLLQVLQEGTFSRVGGETVITADARVIAATNADLKFLSDQGVFRKDLFYRLNVFPIFVPPLRERLEDLPLLTEAFLQKLNSQYSKQIMSVHPAVPPHLAVYEWPGNVRELENIIERAHILEKTDTLTPESFPAELFPLKHAMANLKPEGSETLAAARQRALEEFTARYLAEKLAQHRGSVKETARAADITTRQLSKLMRRYGLKKEDYKRPSPK